MTAPQSPLERHPVGGGDASDQFRDFDLEDVFRDTEREAGAESCQNFVVEFGPHHARIARDLGTEGFRSILENDARGDEYPIRWMWVLVTRVWPVHVLKSNVYVQKCLGHPCAARYRGSRRGEIRLLGALEGSNEDENEAGCRIAGCPSETEA